MVTDRPGSDDQTRTGPPHPPDRTVTPPQPAGNPTATDSVTPPLIAADATPGDEPAPAQIDTTQAEGNPQPGPSPANQEDTPPTRVGRYTILREVARGGVGVVYRARDEEVGREVAVKLLQVRYRKQPAAVRRFVEEARITGRLQHPGVPPVFEVGETDDGSPFLTMKLIKRETLAELLSNGPAHHLIPAFEQVCLAVAYAHDRGVIHRDLKPSNVMVGAFGEVQVMDWGLAKVLFDPAQTEVGESTVPVDHTVIDDPPGRFGRAADPGRERARHPGLHGSGAGGWFGRAGRPAVGRVRSRRHPLRPTDGPAALHGRNGRVHATAGRSGESGSRLRPA